jgi:myo-inositol 2-dehydrogenase/D-chiro-inositol 1-dehydrogenase
MEIKDKLSNIKNIYSINRSKLTKPYRTPNGLIGEMVYYDLDIILNYLNFKMPDSILAISKCEHKELKKVKELEYLDIKLIYNDGIIVNISSSRNSSYGFDDSIEIVDNNGLTKIINQPENNIIYTNYKGESISYLDNNKYIRYRSSYFYLLDYFEKLISNGYPNTIKKEEILKLNKICNIIRKSTKEKRIVKVGGFIKSIIQM